MGIGQILGTILGGKMIGDMFAKPPELPAPPKPEAPPQPGQTPNVQGIVQGQAGTGQAGGAPGVAQTFLTGPGGVDQNALSLGKTTLLGG